MHWEDSVTLTGIGGEYLSARHAILGEIGALVDSGTLRSILRLELAPLSPVTLAEALALVGGGQTAGKIALSVQF